MKRLPSVALLLAAAAVSVAGCDSEASDTQKAVNLSVAMTLAIVVIGAAVGIALLLVKRYTRNLMTSIGTLGAIDAQASPIEFGVFGHAVIQSITPDAAVEASDPGAEFPRYRVELDVTPEDGKPYPVQLTGFIPSMYTPAIGPGTLIRVVIDPQDRDNVRLDFRSLGQLNGPAESTRE